MAEMSNSFGDVPLIMIGWLVALMVVVNAQGSLDTQQELERRSSVRRVTGGPKYPEFKRTTGICTDACYDPDSPVHCEFQKKRWNAEIEYYKSIQQQGLRDQKWVDERYKNCTERLESDDDELGCGSCLKYMHIKNPITICLLLLFIFLVVAGIAANVMFIKGIGPFGKCRAKMNPSSQANPETGLEDGNANANQNPPTDAVGVVDAPPSQSPTQNVVP